MRERMQRSQARIAHRDRVVTLALQRHEDLLYSDHIYIGDIEHLDPAATPSPRSASTRRLRRSFGGAKN
jgi:hypothetical protein